MNKALQMLFENVSHYYGYMCLVDEWKLPCRYFGEKPILYDRGGA